MTSFCPSMNVNEDVTVDFARIAWERMTRLLDPEHANVTKSLSGITGQESKTVSQAESAENYIPKDHKMNLNDIELPHQSLGLILSSSFVPLERSIAKEILQGRSYNIQGSWKLRHTRAFIGWEPTQSECIVPYSASLLFDGKNLKQTSVQAAHIESFLSIGMPKKIEAVLRNREAMRMFSALRNIGVKSEAITYNALVGFAVKKPSWANAMHLV